MSVVKSLFCLESEALTMAFRFKCCKRELCPGPLLVFHSFIPRSVPSCQSNIWAQLLYNSGLHIASTLSFPTAEGPVIGPCSAVPSWGP